MLSHIKYQTKGRKCLVFTWAPHHSQQKPTLCWATVGQINKVGHILDSNHIWKGTKKLAWVADHRPHSLDVYVGHEREHLVNELAYRLANLNQMLPLIFPLLLLCVAHCLDYVWTKVFN